MQNGSKWRCSQWLENSAQTDVDVPLEVAWAMWEDRTRIPTWMPWIKSVIVQEDDPRMSKWTLSTYQFNRQVSAGSFGGTNSQRFSALHLDLKESLNFLQSLLLA